MNKIISFFFCFLFSISFISAASERSNKIYTVVEAKELTRTSGFMWYPVSPGDRFIPSGQCIVDIYYSLELDDGSQMLLYAYKEIYMGNSAAREGIMPDLAINLLSEFTIFPGDVISIDYINKRIFSVTLQKNELQMDASEHKFRPISIDLPGLWEMG